MDLVLRSVKIPREVDAAVEKVVAKQFDGNRSKAYAELLSCALKLPPVVVDQKLEDRLFKRLEAMLIEKFGNQ